LAAHLLNSFAANAHTPRAVCVFEALQPALATLGVLNDGTLLVF
jgi:hypothetical protein